MEITGRLTADAAVKETKTGRKVTNFTIAVNRSYMKDGERKNIATYIDCAYWINSGVAEFLKKGALVLLYGDMDVNAWIDREGNPQGRLSLHTQNIKILAFAGKREEGSPAAKPATGKGKANSKAVAAGTDNHDEDDLPF